MAERPIRQYRPEIRGYSPSWAVFAQKLDKLEQHNWINAADKPDTTTVSQYLKVLDALKLNPSCDKSIKAEPQKKKSSSLAAFTSGFKVVNG